MNLNELIEAIHSGELYNCMDDELMAKQASCLELQYDYNLTRPSEGKKRAELLKKMLAECGEGCYVEPPIHANWGGHNVHFGDHVYANFGLTLVDDTHIYVGSNVLFAPNVVLSTAGHPINPELRKNGYGRILMEKLCEYAKEKGYSGVELSAVETAVGFYKKQGFSDIKNEEFITNLAEDRLDYPEYASFLSKKL